MNYRLLIGVVCFLLLACQGGLSDEQRKQLNEEMKSRTIRKISEGEIMQAALAQARRIQVEIEQTINGKGDSLLNNTIKSLEDLEKVKIQWIITRPDAGLEQELFDAYSFRVPSALPQDNVQKLGQDSIIYTKPIVISGDTISFLSGIWFIRMSRKNIVQSL